MKSRQAVSIGCLLLLSTRLVSAREPALRYKFFPGQTNVFAVEISVRGENGAQISEGNMILVTKDVTTNSVTLASRGTLKPDMKHVSPRRPGFPTTIYAGLPQTVFLADCEIELDVMGNEIRDGGDYVMAAPLGKLVQVLFPPMPAKSADEEVQENVAVLEDPYWLGPADNFANFRPNVPPMMNYEYMGSQHPFSTLLTRREVKSRIKLLTPEQAEWHEETKLASLARIAGEPRLVATSTAEMTFDRSAGLVTNIEIQADVNSQTETTSRHAKVEFKARLLAGAELADALAPPPAMIRPGPGVTTMSTPAAQRKLTEAEINKVMADLKSPDVETRRSAVQQLGGADVDSPPPELLDDVGVMALEGDMYARMTAGIFLSAHATTNQLPVLLKLLKDSDWSTRAQTIRALGRMRDARAAQPLADQLARNGFTTSQETITALVNIGAPAEPAVLGLLNEHNAETQRQACTILQQIGTAASLAPLQNLVADADTQVSQAAADAVRQIKQRQ